MSNNKDIDDTAAALASIPEKTKASITSRFARAIAEIKEVQNIPPVCEGILTAGYEAVLAMQESPNLADDETGRFLMECVVDKIVAASGITNGALLRSGAEPVTVH